VLRRVAAQLKTSTPLTTRAVCTPGCRWDGKFIDLLFMTQTCKLLRDCPATLIPAGDAITLLAGTEVFITQTLGAT